MKKICLVTISVLMLGCAQGRVDVLDQDGKVVGYCSADFSFHRYGAEHSVNYILYLCAREYVDQGYSISDESILDNDYTIPAPPQGEVWSRKTANEQFSRGLISEEKLGYILASVEYQYWMKLEKAEDELSRSAITQAEYEALVKEAKAVFEGV